MKKKTALCSGALLIASFLAPSGPLDAAGKNGEASTAAMKLHHLQIMMNHGLSMSTEGSNLVMIAGMNRTPALDPAALRHGQEMIGNGRVVIRRSREGPEMKSIMEGKLAESPGRVYTHDLGEAMLAVLNILEKMDMAHMQSPETVMIHHMHILLNHALQMAAEGSSLIMIARMGMVEDVDSFSLAHGKKMMARARDLFNETMKGKVMMDLHRKGYTPGKAPLMKMTHELAEAEWKVMELLSGMPRVN
jgi:hypothetical protein